VLMMEELKMKVVVLLGSRTMPRIRRVNVAIRIMIVVISMLGIFSVLSLKKAP